MVDVAPDVVDIVDEGGGVWSLCADGRRIGYVTSTGAAKWWQAAHHIIPVLLVALEEALTARDLLMTELRSVSERHAMEASTSARVPMFASDWTSTVAAEAAEFLAEDEPF